MKRLSLIITILAIVAACSVASMASAAAPAPADVVISNETTTTSYAYPVETSSAHISPDAASKTVAKLHFLTEDGLPEIYLVLASHTGADGVQWMKLRLPMRPNGKTGWVTADSLSDLHTVHTQLVVNRTTLRATLYKNGRKVFTTVVGVGKASTPTPAGNFYVREKLTNLGGAYGPLAFGTSNYSTLSEWPKGGVIGIHGTDEPGLLPGRVSHGCIRIPNANVVKLARLMGLGTPVRVI